MNQMLLGLLMFFAVHLMTATPPLRAAITRRIGDNPWRGVVSLVSLGGLILVGMGWATTPNTPLFAPQAWARQSAPLLVTVALILFVIGGGKLPGYLRRYLHHPMLYGVILWASTHLLANGGLRETLLFGSFLAFATYALVTLLAAGKRQSYTPALKWDVIGAAIGIVVAAGVMHGHAWLFGVPAI